MIFKSYLIEQDIKKIRDYNIFLFYGENQGLKKEFKDNIKSNEKSSQILNLVQDDIIRNKNILINEIANKSLFDTKKVILIDGVGEKIIEYIEEIKEKIQDEKLYLFANILDKKSKLRSFFEKSESYGISACYNDNEITIKKIITEKLKNFSGFNSQILNLIIKNTGLDRIKVDNELQKITCLFNDKHLEQSKLSDLLNVASNEDFGKLKDAAFDGDKIRTNLLLTETTFESENVVYYLNIINQRINKILEILNLKEKNTSIEISINNMKPPIFWKDKPILIKQSKIWDKNRLINAQKNTYLTELKVKSSSTLKNDLLVKNLLVDLCMLAKNA